MTLLEARPTQSHAIPLGRLHTELALLCAQYNPGWKVNGSVETLWKWKSINTLAVRSTAGKVELQRTLSSDVVFCCRKILHFLFQILVHFLN